MTTLHSARWHRPVLIAVALATVILPASLQTQTPARRPLPLDEALELAMATSKQLRMAQAAVARAEADEDRARSAFIPSFDASLGYTRTHESEFDALGPGLPGAFGSHHKYQLGVDAVQPLFTGGRLAAQSRMAAAAKRSRLVELASAAAQLTLDVTRAYLDAALADQIVEIAAGTLARADTALVQTRAANNVGSQSDYDVLRAQVARDNERVNLIRHSSDRDLAHVRLKKLLSLPGDTALVLTTSIEAEVRDIVTASYQRDKLMRIPFELRAPVLEAAEAVRIAEQQVTAARAQHFPSVSLFSQYGRVSYPASGALNWNDFRSNWLTGVSLRVPLFQGGRIVAETGAAQADLAEARARFEQIRDYAELDLRAAIEKLESATAAWDASSGTVEQARAAYRIAEVRYREGVSTQIELTDARLLLQQAEMNRARAAAELRVAQTRMALIHELPIE
ncbi:MAG TPA: TolC family protein [Longimicrobiales bacterium]